MNFTRKHLLGIRELEAAEITHLLIRPKRSDISRREISRPALRGAQSSTFSSNRLHERVLLNAAATFG